MADDTPDLKRIIKVARDFSRPYRVDDGRRFRLKDYPAGDTAQLKSEDKPRAQEALDIGRNALAELQDMLYAQDRWSVLLVFQAMDAAGKDGAIKHVMSGVNPQGCRGVLVQGAHVGRARPRLPVALRRTCRSAAASASSTARYYEEVLVVRVHPEFLRSAEAAAAARRQEPLGRTATRTSVRSSATSRNGVVIRKFFLHVSREEQKRRFLERLEKPEKNWKFSAAT